MYHCEDTGESVFVGFETSFTTLAVLFLALWWLFCINWTYCCQDTGGIVFLLVLKPVLPHSPLNFENFGGYFALFGRIVAKIPAKKFLCWLWNRICGIAASFWVLVALLRQSAILLPRYRRKRFLAGFETGFTAFAAAFWALWWLFCVNRKYHCQNYRQKHFFADFETGFIAFATIFWALWWLFCVNWKYL